MGTRRFAPFSRNARTLTWVGNRLSSPQVRHCHDRAWSPPRADDPDRPRLLHDDPIALNLSPPPPVAARLVVGPDDVRDVGARRPCRKTGVCRLSRPRHYGWL